MNENALMTVDAESVVSHELTITRAPEDQLAEAQTAAKALMGVVSKKAKPVKFNGEVYLEFEDWQTVGKFYGLAARVTGSKYIEVGTAKGYEASAELIHVPTAQVVSAADSMCLNDEPNWARKPLFQLRSMAQTRACAKAFRNAVSWVVVLAGYRPTPAEEMDGVIAEAAHKPATAPQKPVAAPVAHVITEGAVPVTNTPKPAPKAVSGDEYEICDLIDRLTKKETKKAGTYRYGFHLAATQKWVNSFSSDLASEAEVWIEGKVPVILIVKDGQYGTDVISAMEDTRTEVC
jgi:hypothetical protein